MLSYGDENTSGGGAKGVFSHTLAVHRAQLCVEFVLIEPGAKIKATEALKFRLEGPGR